MSYPLDPWDDFECALNSYERAIGNLHYSEALKPPSEIDPAVVLLDKSVPQPMRDAVAALVNLGYAQPQAAAAIAAAARNTGAGADAAKLIRLGVRQAKLAKNRRCESFTG